MSSYPCDFTLIACKRAIQAHTHSIYASMGAVSGEARTPASDAVYDAVMMSVWKHNPISASLHLQFVSVVTLEISSQISVSLIC